MIILASRSPRRSELLAACNIEFRCIPSDFEEDEDDFPYISSLPLEFAMQKARQVALLHPEDIVIGVDTVVCCNDRIYGKPSDLAEAGIFLKELSGRDHKVISGVAVLCLAGNISSMFIDQSIVVFRELEPSVIQKYFSKVNPLDKAGGYAIQEYGDMIIDSLDGSYNNVIGLPTEKLIPCLELVRRECFC